MTASKITPLLIVDLEATYWENSRLPNGQRQSIGNMEIIEFGCALATRAGELLDSRSFLVRPVRNPHLSSFCRSLTGINQAMVNAAPLYPEVVRDLDNWLDQPTESLVWCRHDSEASFPPVKQVGVTKGLPYQSEKELLGTKSPMKIVIVKARTDLH